MAPSPPRPLPPGSHGRGGRWSVAVAGAGGPSGRGRLAAWRRTHSSCSACRAAHAAWYAGSDARQPRCCIRFVSRTRYPSAGRNRASSAFACSGFTSDKSTAAA